jgi:HYR domain
MVRKITLFLLALCVPALAFGQITSISPQSLYVGPYEDFLTIYGSNLVGSETTPERIATVIRISGPGGTFELDAVAAQSDQRGPYIVTWIPQEVSATEGTYQIDVYAKDIDVATPRHYGPVFLTVIQFQEPLRPILAVPESVFAVATSIRGTVVTYDVSATSQGGTGLSVTCSPQSGSSFPMGTTTVECTATDSVGSVTERFPVIVADLTRPIITSAPQDITTAERVVTFTISAFDEVDGENVIIACDPASGTTFPFGTTIVQCDVYDQSLNPAHVSFKVTVTGGAPELTMPENVRAEATSAAGAVVNYTVTATEGGVVSCQPASGSQFPIGETVVDCTATNSVGSTSGSFSVFVVDVDNTPPVVTVTANPSTLWPPDGKMVNVTLTIVATDNRDPNPVSLILSVTTNQPENGTGDGNTTPDWIITGPNTLQLRAERAGNNDRIYTITVLTTDDAGNSTETTVQVKVTQQNNKAKALRF